MGPILIIDKSALQALSFQELLILHENFFLNIVPVLMSEILGDIKKPMKGSLSKEKVAELAGKVFPFNSSINRHYQDLLRVSLLGGDVPLDRCTILAGGDQVRTTQGERGIIFEESPEEKALHRWKEGNFTVAEELLGERWRESTRQLDLNGLKQAFQSLTQNSLNIRDFMKLDEVITKTLDLADNQRDMLKLALGDFHLPIADAQRTFLRWETSGFPPLRVFAPYAYHCLRVNLFFTVGISHDLIGTRPTNRVDMEYLYYLPFCMVFCSDDKFHRNVAPFFIGANQRFIRGTELKADLTKRVQGQRDACNTTDHAQSLTEKLWEEFMAGPSDNYPNFAATMNKEQKGKLAAFILSKLKNATLSQDGSTWNTQEADFVIKKGKITMGDTCPCGSRKTYGECHGSQSSQTREIQDQNDTDPKH